MKKLIYFLSSVTFLLLCLNSYGQLPLQYGDGVITHSPTGYILNSPPSNYTPTSNGPVIRIIHTSNTSTAPLGSNWGVPPKQSNDYYPNWVSSNLGPVFGITLDDQTPPNIYVSSTQIYHGTGNNNRKIWRINGTTGANTLVYDFNNPSGSGTNTSWASLGNLKYAKIGGVSNIYVSDFETGEIHRLTGNPASTSLWTPSSDFKPSFATATANDGHPISVPYGIAIRNMPDGSKTLYYAKLNTTAMYGTYEIWSVDLNAVGDFIPSTETMLSLPSHINFPPYPSELTAPYGPKAPISDLAFTQDGSKLLIGQQSWYQFSSSLGAHYSMVIELENTPFNSNTWVESGNYFASGNHRYNANCVGGVSYSNNILQTNQQYACDTSVYFTSDVIKYTSEEKVYGVEGMANSGGDVNSAIWIDEDDYYGYRDKHRLGDVEIYKKPGVCRTCSCGEWESIQFNKNATWWTGDPNPVPSITIQPQNITGVIFPHYDCEGDCDATFDYYLRTNDHRYPLNGDNYLDLGRQPIFQKMPCGQDYTIEIVPTCGGEACQPIRIPISIPCKISCDCSSDTKIDIEGKPEVHDGKISGSFIIDNSVPVTEVRVLVEKFSITSDNENCILCKNPPKSWGSILKASLGNISHAYSSSPEVDNREAVFENNAILQMPSPLKLTLALPESTGLSCCTVKVDLCLKITIRDVNCCEKEVLKCFSFELDPPK